jgi:hypothetical protein
VHLVSLGFQPAKEAANPIPVAGVPKFLEFAGGSALALHDKPLMLGGETGKGNIEGNAMAAAGLFQVALAILEAFGLPGFNDSAGNRKRSVGKGELVVDFHDAAETPAKGAGTDGMVEGEERRGGLVKVTLIAGAVVSAGVELKFFGVCGPSDGGGALAKPQAGGERLGNSGPVRWCQGETVLNHRQEKLFLGSLTEGVGEFFQPFLLVETDGLAIQKDAAEALAGNEGGGFVGGSFFGEGDAEKEPRLLSGKLFQ